MNTSPAVPRAHAATRCYIASVIAVLLFTALAKLTSFFDPAPVMSEPDPIFPFLSGRWMMTAAAALEVAAIALLLRPLSLSQKMGVIAWLGVLFSVYRFGRLLGGFSEPCKCLGTSLAWTHLSEEALKTISFGLLLYLAIPSIAWTALDAVRRSRANRTLSVERAEPVAP